MTTIRITKTMAFAAEVLRACLPLVQHRDGLAHSWEQLTLREEGGSEEIVLLEVWLHGVPNRISASCRLVRVDGALVEGVCTIDSSPSPWIYRCILVEGVVRPISQYVTVPSLFRQCSYPLRKEPLAASDTCRKTATSEAVDGEKRYWRCNDHEGVLPNGETGEVVKVVWRNLEPAAPKPSALMIEDIPPGDRWLAPPGAFFTP